jgi:hypothetical protein
MSRAQNGEALSGIACGGGRTMPFGRFRSAVSAGALTATLHRPKGTPRGGGLTS